MGETDIQMDGWVGGRVRQTYRWMGGWVGG